MFQSPGSEETQLGYSVQLGHFSLRKADTAENGEGNLKADKMFHKRDLGRKVKGTASVY